MQEIDQEQFPFITGITYAKSEYYGIVVNYDNTILTMYDLSKMPDKGTRSLFVTLGETWWWESNRSIPINLFLKEEWAVFSSCKMVFNNKNLTILSGPCTSLNDISQKRSKRKSITLIRNID